MGAGEIHAFLTDLAVRGRVSASTQNQAFSALLFLYQKVLEVEPGRIEGVVRANRPKRLPVVLSPQEVQRIVAELDDDLHARPQHGPLPRPQPAGCPAASDPHRDSLRKPATFRPAASGRRPAPNSNYQETWLESCVPEAAVIDCKSRKVRRDRLVE
jgi:integrase